MIFRLSAVTSPRHSDTLLWRHAERPRYPPGIQHLIPLREQAKPRRPDGMRDRGEIGERIWQSS